MSGFHERIINDQALKNLTVNFFAEFLSDQVFYRNIGVEQTLPDIHENIRHKYDKTTEFIRYFPDGFLCWNQNNDHPSYLIELKTATTGLCKDDSSLMEQMKKTVPDLKKEEVVNIELGSFLNLEMIKDNDINVVIWLFVTYHLQSNWLAIIPNQSLILHRHMRGTMINTRGSGTSIANIFTRIDNNNIFFLWDWISKEFGLENDKVKDYFLNCQEIF